MVVFDDVWTQEHERKLNFVDAAEAPDTNVLVTSRFSKLLPGYVEVALGLLSGQEAAKLLLGMAELSSDVCSTEQLDAVAKMAKLAGFLPLYVTLIGRLICELGPGEPWEVEVLALLTEDRGAAFGDNGNQLGAKIVGSSLAQIKDPEALELFSAMAVLAEDVPAPMSALELIWCAQKEAVPPLGRIGTYLSLRTSGLLFTYPYRTKINL